MHATTEVVPALVLSQGHATAAAALDSIGVPQELVHQALSTLSDVVPIVHVALADYRAAGGSALVGALWSAYPEDQTLIVVARAHDGSFVVGCGLATYASASAEAAAALLRDFVARTGRDWFAIERAALCEFETVRTLQ